MYIYFGCCYIWFFYHMQVTIVKVICDTSLSIFTFKESVTGFTFSVFTHQLVASVKVVALIHILLW